jgi:hypothetical protein
VPGYTASGSASAEPAAVAVVAMVAMRRWRKCRYRDPLTGIRTELNGQTQHSADIKFDEI